MILEWVADELCAVLVLEKSIGHARARLGGCRNPRPLWLVFVCCETTAKNLARGDFDRRRAITTDGRPIGLISCGMWNLLAGPDFLGVRIRIGDSIEITGDIEVYLRASDW